MKRLIWLVGLWAILAVHHVVAGSQVKAQLQEEQKIKQLSALSYLQKMQQAYKQLNYELIYINTTQHPIEPMALLHGQDDDQDITYLRFLNGASRESFQVDNKISYYEQGNHLYSVVTQKDQGIFAGIANLDLLSVDGQYQYQVLGQGRVADKKAIAIRILAKDQYRFGYVVWLDMDSYLPLRLDTINQASEIIEQVLVVSLSVTDNIDVKLIELGTHHEPEPKIELESTDLETVKWQIEWLPNGFEMVKGDQHKLILHDTDPVTYIMLSDGMVIVSVYISTKSTTAGEQEGIVQRGGTLLYTLQQGIIEVTIIGEIPLITAEKIAASIKAVE